MVRLSNSGAPFSVCQPASKWSRSWPTSTEGGQRGVIDLAAADPAHVELVPGGEQRFEKQVAVVFRRERSPGR
ncbi:hypothetical protein HAALTHF_26410n [Vreelandella aquamarina]|nr:hypothetical protein HAALTHF_26410n [Halomonas axialensis]